MKKYLDPLVEKEEPVPPKILSINYASGGGTGSAPASPVSASYGTSVTMPENTYTKPGHTFFGWAVSGAGSIAGIYMPGTVVAVSDLSTAIANGNAGITLTAAWSGDTYTVTFNKNNTDEGSTDANPTTKTVTLPVTTVDALPAAPTRPGYIFAGWYTVPGVSGGTEFTASSTVSASVTVYARWTGYTLSINYDPGGGTGSAPASPVSASYGTSVTMPANTYSNPGYTFAGWAVSGTGSITGTYAVGASVAVTALSNAIGNGNAGITLTAKWKADIDMVYVPAGTFMMGSPASEPNRGSNETQHSVTLTKSFYMGKYQVTQAQWIAVMGAGEDRTTSTYGKGDNYPIYNVNWYDALVFCNRLSVIEGLDPVYSIGGSTDPAVWIENNGGSIPTSINGTWNAAVMDRSKNGYRLPTEAEWEYACRGDYPDKATETNTKPFGIGDGTKITGSMANFRGTYPYDLNHVPPGQYNDGGGTNVEKTTEVGSYAANNYGLYDMHGNVEEWCWDWYDSGYYSTSPGTNPTGPNSAGSYRVRRGGSWYDNGQYLRSAFRNSCDPIIRSRLIGFRLVRAE